VTFSDPVAIDLIAGAERKVGIAFPQDLMNALQESDGIVGKYELALVWPLERIVKDNLTFRNNAEFASLYMPFDHLLFFGDAGNGDQFAYSVARSGRIEDPDIFVWDHENCSRKWAAPNLAKYLEWWITGQLKL